jgi:hypothetical protein
MEPASETSPSRKRPLDPETQAYDRNWTRARADLHADAPADAAADGAEASAGGPAPALAESAEEEPLGLAAAAAQHVNETTAQRLTDWIEDWAVMLAQEAKQVIFEHVRARYESSTEALMHDALVLDRTRAAVRDTRPCAGVRVAAGCAPRPDHPTSSPPPARQPLLHARVVAGHENGGGRERNEGRRARLAFADRRRRHPVTNAIKGRATNRRAACREGTRRCRHRCRRECDRRRRRASVGAWRGARRHHGRQPARR